MMWVLNLPWRGNSYEYPQHIFLWRAVENHPLLARLNNIQEELLYYPRRWCWHWHRRRHPQMLRFYVKVISLFPNPRMYWFMFHIMIDIGQKIYAVPSPPLHDLNPYKLSVPFLGHRQTLQTQIRRRRTLLLIGVLIVCYLK